MSPFMRLHFRLRRAGWRGRALAVLLFRLALLGVGMFLVIEVGKVLVTIVAVAAAVAVAVLCLGAFTADWRNAGVTIGRQYRRLNRRLTRTSGEQQ